jgi:hypothetical protein
VVTRRCKTNQQSVTQRTMSLSNTPHIAVVQRDSLRWLPDSPIDSPAEVFSIELGKYFMGEQSGTVDWAMAGVRQVLDGSTEGKLRVPRLVASNN